MKVEPRVRENLQLVQERDGPLLAVAIAATLVEYQRYSKQRTRQEDLNIMRGNWQTVVRMEQLRGQG